MKRLFFLLFFVMSILQLAAPGMQKMAAQLNVTAFTEVRLEGLDYLSIGTADGAANCFSHSEKSNQITRSGCTQGMLCSLCNMCQACHQAVLAESQAPGALQILAQSFSPSVAIGYFSAEHAQSFKPPIL